MKILLLITTLIIPSLSLTVPAKADNLMQQSMDSAQQQANDFTGYLEQRDADRAAARWEYQYEQDQNRIQSQLDAIQRQLDALNSPY